MNKQRQTDAGRIRHSITNKLNRKLFFRLVGLFISIDVIIIIIACVGLWIYSERKIVDAVAVLDGHELPEDGAWLGLAGLSIEKSPAGDAVSSYEEAWPFPGRGIHDRMEDIYHRGFRVHGGSLNNALRSVEYVIVIKSGDVIYTIAQNVGAFVLYFFYLYAILLAYELLSLMSRSFGDRRLVRRTLDPISELARAAQSLNEVNRQLDHEMTMALAGRLDGIDAGRLDTRIPVDELQEELKNVAVAINGMLDRINESYAAQARFVSDASHELRTPIAVIQGYANLLDRWGKEDEKALSESVNAIKDEADNMKGLVEQLLFLARGDSNRIRLSEERFGLRELVEEVAGEARMLDDGRDIVTSCGAVDIVADRALIKQALRILVDNAVKYTDIGGEIKIAVERDEESARLMVSDTGIGISPTTLPHVFDRFVRADESRARATGGAGLGLSIAQWIASRHNGYIDILSREGVGTRISLVLPAAPDVPEVADAAVAVDAAIAATAAPDVLEVVDEPVVID
ncbi:MAG: HAMP domain-containing histidine kinase [Oscillospiraceae bacterium]|nr:HAMP domain-containing histidine kinase [Oscillospiraceae bacterium]